MLKLCLSVAVASAALVCVAFWAPIDGSSGRGLWRFIGRFHVLVVHFPIVLLLIAPVLDWLAARQRFRRWRAAALPVWLAGSTSAVGAALLGLLLAANEGHRPEQVEIHMLTGLGAAIVAVVATALHIARERTGGRLVSRLYVVSCAALVVSITITAHAGGSLVHGERYLIAHVPQALRGLLPEQAPGAVAESDDPVFNEQIRPVMQQYCFDCHGPDLQKGNMRLDVLDPDLIHGHDQEQWQLALDMLSAGDMPPEKKPQPSAAQRASLVDWIGSSLAAAVELRRSAGPGRLRRLTREQYAHALQDLLGLPIDFGVRLPGEAKSELGFTNSHDTLQTSALHIDAYRAIAQEALDKAIVDGRGPDTTRLRVSFGSGIGTGQPAGRYEAFVAVPLDTDDFRVHILDAQGHAVQPRDDAHRAELEAIKRHVGVGLRGSSRDRFAVTDEGILLYSALPHKEVAPTAWQGPSPNLKLQLQRVFPAEGYVAMRVTAARALPPNRPPRRLVRAPAKPAVQLGEDRRRRILAPDGSRILTASKVVRFQGLRRRAGSLLPRVGARRRQVTLRFEIATAGRYQFDLVFPKLSKRATKSTPAGAAGPARVRLDLSNYGGLNVELPLDPEGKASRSPLPLGVAHLEPGTFALKLGGEAFAGLRAVVVSPYKGPLTAPLYSITPSSPERSRELLAKPASLQPFAGTLVDDGMTYERLAPFRELAAGTDTTTYEFVARLENLPMPARANQDTAVLSGIALFGVWNTPLVKESTQAGAPLLIKSIELEAPYNPDGVWPPRSHRAIFTESQHAWDRDRYTPEILGSFLSRAFRRPASMGEVARYTDLWRSLKDDYPSYEQSIKAVLVAALCSPSFLFLDSLGSPESANEGGAGERHVAQHALASRLAFFLWNSPPDPELSTLAEQGRLLDELPSQVERLLQHERSWRFVRVFSREWLRLDRHEALLVDADKYPEFSRFVKRDMTQETYHFVHRVLQENLSIMEFIDSDFVMLNQNLAEYYGIAGVSGNHFRPVVLTRERGRGGLLSQGAFLSGHSTGLEAHPIKRAVWLKERILGIKPPEPPPNVPELDPETPGFEKLSLKQQLQLHRSKKSCRDCHEKIDPYGLVFEAYDATGRLMQQARGRPIDDATELHDGTRIQGLPEMKSHILEQLPDRFAMALIKYLFAYALGREPSFADRPELKAILKRAKEHDYGMRSLIHGIVSSPSFHRI
ncbi:MAG: DUF1592 domain-containing protein [Proteobacteria bacterium]|nr:DUF1592 domain-containing protein [Pseudomonadota bacterium]